MVTGRHGPGGRATMRTTVAGPLGGTMISARRWLTLATVGVLGLLATGCES